MYLFMLTLYFCSLTFRSLNNMIWTLSFCQKKSLKIPKRQSESVYTLLSIVQLTSLVEQELLTLPEHLNSPPVFSGVRVTRSLVLYVCFVAIMYVCTGVTAESNRKPTYLDIFGSKKTKGIKQDIQNLLRSSLPEGWEH
jgi:hypothetical protein